MGATAAVGRALPARSSPVAPRAWVLWLLIGLVLAPGLVITRADPDLWGHVRFGLDMLAQHTLPSVDPYSFTQDIPWVNHEWLSELLMGVAYSIRGPSGLSLLRGALVTVFLVVALQPYLRASPLAAGAAVVLLVSGTVRQTMTLRPQLWTLIGVAVLCRLFVAGYRRYWIFAVPAMFLLWVNLHGGWIVGAGLLAMWTAFQLVNPADTRARIVAVALFSALATLINPYGLGMWAFLAGTVRMSRAISEWQPLFTSSILAPVTWTAMILATLFLVITRPRPPVDRVAMIAMLAFGAFRVERLAPLSIVCSVVLMSPTVIERWAARPRRALPPLSRAEARGLALGIVVLALVSIAATARQSSCVLIGGPWIPDRNAGAALAATTTRGRIVTYFDWGEYAIWHLAPRLRVSIDGRRETIYSDAALARHDALEAATPDGLAYLRQLDPTYVWLPARFTTLRDWLATHGYRIDVQTAMSFVAVRSDQPVLQPVPAATTACFPGP